MLPGLILPPPKSQLITLVDRTAGSYIGGMGSAANAFNGVTNSPSDNGCAFNGNLSGAWLGKRYAVPITFAYAVVYGSNNYGFLSFFEEGVLVINVRGKLGSDPSNKSDGVLLGTIAFNDTDDERAGRRIDTLDTWGVYDRVWVELGSAAGGFGDFFLAEIVLYQAISLGG